MKKAVLLLSSGLDSTVNLYEAVRDYEVTALTLSYGQKALAREVEKSKILTQKLKVDHQIIELSFFKNLGSSSLTSEQISIPVGDEIKIDSIEKSQSSALKVWVPNRNGIFLNIAAGIAEALNAEVVIPGFNLEEAQTFPDNSEDFMKALDQSFSFSTANGVKVFCYTTRLNKTKIFKRAIELKIDFKDLWPCYKAKERWCGECESCLRFHRAAKDNQYDTRGLYELSS